jgi:hypothetical protein
MIREVYKERRAHVDKGIREKVVGIEGCRERYW